MDQVRFASMVLKDNDKQGQLAAFMAIFHPDHGCKKKTIVRREGRKAS